MAAARKPATTAGSQGAQAGEAHTAKPHSGSEPVSQPAQGGRIPRPPVLDARLRAAADWVTPCGVCADIGCDHGRLSAVLLLENRCRTLLAADVSPKALAKAEARIADLHLTERAIFAAADGLDALEALPQRRADTVCILGMGGETLAGILARGRERLRGAQLVLGAQTELPLLRAAVRDIGYRFTDERVVRADGRLYILMRAMPAPEGAPAYTERELLLGPCLLATLPPEWDAWLMRRQSLLQKAAAALRDARVKPSAERLATLTRELAMTEEALAALHRNALREEESDP